MPANPDSNSHTTKSQSRTRSRLLRASVHEEVRLTDVPYLDDRAGLSLVAPWQLVAVGRRSTETSCFSGGEVAQEVSEYLVQTHDTNDTQ